MSAVVERAAARAVDDVAARLVAALDAVPGMRAARTAEGVVVSGRDLTRRALTEPALRRPADLIR